MTIAHGKSSSACPGLETLAAYLDGRLETSERAEVAAHLADCEACYEVYADSARFRLEEAASEEDSEVVEHPARRRGRPLAWAGALLAAGLAAVALWTPLFDGGGGGSVASRARGLHGEPFDAAGWSVVRSGGGWAAGLGERQRSFRAGVRVVDLLVALEAGRSDAARTILPELVDYAGSFELSEAIVAQLEEVEARLESPGGAAEAAELAAEASAWLGEAADPDWYAFGAWAETGRLAAAAGDDRHFRRRAFGRTAERMAAAELSPRVAEALGRVRARLAAGVDPSDLGELGDDLAEITTRAANPGG